MPNDLIRISPMHRIVLSLVQEATSDGIPYPTLQSIADKLTLTRERVRQLANDLRTAKLLAPGPKLCLPGTPPRASTAYVPRQKKDPALRFKEYVIQLPDGCHRWSGGVCANGYGRFSLNGKAIYAHRAAYILFVGPIPEGRQALDHVCHRCDYAACVNHAHLFLGTALDNVRDRESKGRGRLTKVVRHRIRTLLAQGLSRTEIAENLGIHRDRVQQVMDEINWR